MKAKHVMVTPVKTAKADMTVRDVAQILSDNRISALPVVDNDGAVIGIISEGDLIHRAEIGTQRRRSWWLSLLTSNVQLAEEYAKTNARKIGDLMTHSVVTVDPETQLSDIATIFERRNIKRVPVVEHNHLIGIVTRGNLVQAIATAPQKVHRPLSDDAIRDKVFKKLESEPWASVEMLNVTVNGGIVYLWGFARSDAERNAMRVAAESIAGVEAVHENLSLEPLPAWI